MIPIFDLDDTLYPEISFVKSGFKAVSNALETKYGWSSKETMMQMLSTLETEGRGLVFDRLLLAHGVYSKKMVSYCLSIYRNHKPIIQLDSFTNATLKLLENKPYLVTDGNKYVQNNKIKALGIEKLFKKIYITHRYGLKMAKPSIHCFELIRKQENCNWSNMFYVGDNPAKDFVNLNALGVQTIRVRTGSYANVKPLPGFEAKYEINSLSELNALLKGIPR